MWCFDGGVAGSRSDDCATHYRRARFVDLYDLIPWLRVDVRSECRARAAPATFDFCGCDVGARGYELAVDLEVDHFGRWCEGSGWIVLRACVEEASSAGTVRALAGPSDGELSALGPTVASRHTRSAPERTRFFGWSGLRTSDVGPSFDRRSAFRSTLVPGVRGRRPSCSGRPTA